MTLHRLLRISLVCGPFFLAACGDDSQEAADNGDTTGGTTTETTNVTLTTAPSTDPSGPTTDPSTTTDSTDTTGGSCAMQGEPCTPGVTDCCAGLTCFDDSDETWSCQIDEDDTTTGTTGETTTGETTTGEDTETTGDDTTGGMTLECADENIGDAVGDGVATGSTENAADTFSISCASGGGPDYVVQWTAPHDGLYLIHTIDAGSTYDTALALFPADCMGQEIACNDDASGSTVLSALLLSADEGDTFLIVVDGFDGDTGSFVLNIVDAPPEWTCNPLWYEDGQDCDCGCGVLDPDCADATLASCDFCDLAGSCSTMDCPGNTEIDPDNNAVCQ